MLRSYGIKKNGIQSFGLVGFSFLYMPYEGSPSSLNAVAYSDTIIDVNWTNTMIGEDSITLERRTENTEFAFLVELDPGIVHYQNINLTSGTKYYYRAYATKSGENTRYSNIGYDWTAIKFIMTSKGTGAALSNFGLIVNNETTATIDGNGKFYDDLYGTIGETTNKTLNSSITNLYVKVSSGTSNILIFNKLNITSLGWWSFTNSPWISFDLSILPSNLTYLGIYGGNTITGTLDNLPSTIISLSIYNSTITGSIDSLPEGLTFFNLWTYGSITGSVNNLPRYLTSFSCSSNTLTGTFYGLPRGLTYIYIAGDNTITGSIADLPPGLQYIRFSGLSTITGYLDDIPSTLMTFEITGPNTIGGTINNLPENLVLIYILGSNVITGNIGNINEGMLSFSIDGNNTLYGELNELHEGITSFIVAGLNTISGTINQIPISITVFILSGQNTVTGYTSGHAWSTNMYFFMLHQIEGYGLSSTEVDNLLIDFSNTTWIADGYSRIDLLSPNAVRTSASDSAVDTLTDKIVTLNLAA